MWFPWNTSKPFLASQYILQGTLYGLQLQYLPIILRKTGSSLLTVGSLHLLTFPWLLKSIWAPLIDLYNDRNVWLSICYGGIATALTLCATTMNYGLAFALALVLLNVFSATVDLTLGKILITDFQTDEASKGTSLQIVGYKVGFLFGGGLALLLSDYFDLYKELFLALSVVYILLALTCCVTKRRVHAKPEAHSTPEVHCLPEVHYTPEVPYAPEVYRAPEVHCETEVHCAPEVNYAPIVQCVPEVCGYSLPDCTRFNGFTRTPGITWMMVCACVYKFASHSSQSLLTMFLVDHGESIVRIGFLSGIAGQLISITVASVCGVVLAAKWMSPIQLLVLTSLLSVCSVVVQLWIVTHGDPTLMRIPLVYVLHNLVHGSQATPVYTLMLRCSQGAPRTVRATVFSFLGTLEIFGKQLALFLAGVLAEFFGYAVGMAISFTVSVLVFCLTKFCPGHLKKAF